MRLIDADALIARLEKEAEQMENPIGIMFTYAAINDIKREPTITVPQWIPVTERLPKRCQYYFVTDFGEVDEAYYGSDGRWFSDGHILKDVTAWMPLPAPYKED